MPPAAWRPALLEWYSSAARDLPWRRTEFSDRYGAWGTLGAVFGARIGIAAAFGLVIGAALFAGDLTLRQYAGHGLFPMAAPTGGSLLIASWLTLAVAAAWPKRG